MTPIRFHPDAEAEMLDSAVWYESQQKGLGKRFLTVIQIVELNLTKVESFNVDQSILGRIFGYGTLTINGTGGIRTPIPSIVRPLEFRRAANEQIEQAQR